MPKVKSTIYTTTKGALTTIWSNRVKIGYIHNTAGGWYWELLLVSEQFKGYPRGAATTMQEAVANAEKYFRLWCVAAGLKQEA